MKLTLAAAAISLAFGLPTLAQASGSASITQSGVDNYGSIEQESTTGTSALIQQFGDRNSAGSPASGEVPAVQGVRQVNETFSFAYVYQNGNDNGGWILQQDGSSNTARMWQGPNTVSNGNWGTVEQIGSTGSFGEVFQDNSTGGNGSVRQSGEANRGIVVQGNYSWNGSVFVFTGGLAVNNFATVFQSGDHLSGVVDQLGSNHSGHVSQNGAWNDANIMQEGSFNFATINQFGTGGSAGDRNVATVNQNGTGFSAGVSQSGMRNTALINQH